MKNWQFMVITALLLIVVVLLMFGTPAAHRIEARIIENQVQISANGMKIDNAQATLTMRTALFDSIFTDLKNIHDNLDAIKARKK